MDMIKNMNPAMNVIIIEIAAAVDTGWQVGQLQCCSLSGNVNPVNIRPMQGQRIVNRMPTDAVM
jgi:hypothetical protein